MRILVQRALRGSVSVDQKIVASIEKGLLCLVGFSVDDDKVLNLSKVAQKLVDLRIFSDSQGKMNLSVRDIEGEVLLVSQFTLYADTSRGNRPGFDKAMKAQIAETYFSNFVEEVRKLHRRTQCGIFQAHMQVSLINDGPVTILLEY